MTRGCILDTPNACSDNDVVGCVKCNTSGCNTKNVVASKCKICTSEDTEVCKTNGDSVPNTECVDGNQLYSARGCFTQVSGNITKRGCFSTLTLAERDVCVNIDDTLCKRCFVDGCNSTTALHLLSVSWISTVLVLIKNYF